MQTNTIVSFFDSSSNKFYRLFATKDWPCLEISGVRMHCVEKGVKASTQAMVRALGDLHGIVLDTCAGLGYTTIMIAESPQVRKVHAFEIDSNVLSIARQNPCSAKLFSSKKIFLENADVVEGIKEFPESFFDLILHDPPRLSLAGDLYGRPFYCELFRVLKPGGTLFHYTGAPGEKKGIDFKTKTMKRLKQCGFREIEKVEEAFGVRAKK
ncbi:MAG: methyltransferase domain-containing protein [Candidatus Diapherotrites archaeon]